MPLHEKTCALICPHPIASTSRAISTGAGPIGWPACISATCQGENQAPVATLTGRLRDQAELAGVLDTLYEMHLVLLKVEYLNGD